MVNHKGFCPYKTKKDTIYSNIIHRDYIELAEFPLIIRTINKHKIY